MAPTSWDSPELTAAAEPASGASSGAGPAYVKLLAIRGVAALATVLTLWQVSSNVSPAAFGQFSLFLSLVTAATMSVVNWPDGALIRFGREEWRTQGSMGHVLAGRAALYLASALAAILVARAASGPIRQFLAIDSDPFLFVALGVALLPLSQIFICVNQAIGEALPYGLIPLMVRLAFLAGVGSIALGAGRDSWEYLAGWWLIGSALAAGVSSVLLPRGLWRGWTLTKPTIRRLVFFSWAVPIGTAASYLVQSVDPWVIRAYLGSAPVGIYSWAYQVTVLVGFFLTPLVPILTPAAVDARLTGQLGILEGHGPRSFRFVLLAAAGGAILLPLVYPLLSALAGVRYSASYEVVLILLSATPGQLLTYLIIPIEGGIEQLINRVVLISLTMALANVVGDVALTPLIGLAGPAATTAAVFILGALAHVRLISRYMPALRFPRPAVCLVPLLVLPAAAAALVFVVRPWGDLLSIGFGVVLITATRQLGLFKTEDANWVERQPLPHALRRLTAAGLRWLARG